jgi:SAM-dependent methyltransferase
MSKAWVRLFPHQKKYSRFRFVSWPLTIFEQSDQLRKSNFPFREKTKRTRYPIKGLRYWWLYCAIWEELQQAATSTVIADVGCERGILKRFISPIQGACLIGLDIRLDEKALELDQYDELHCCDFDSELPMRDSRADIRVCCHVLEHLPRPDFTMGELTRILRPGGLMLISISVVSSLMAYIHEWQFGKQFKTGTRRKLQHMHAFWPGRICHLAEKCGLEVEFMSGTCLLRKQGSRLENYAFWILINQVWGDCFLR